jgi:hypothetical protein
MDLLAQMGNYQYEKMPVPVVLAALQSGWE